MSLVSLITKKQSTCKYAGFWQLNRKQRKTEHKAQSYIYQIRLEKIIIN